MVPAAGFPFVIRLRDVNKKRQPSPAAFWSLVQVQVQREAKSRCGQA